MSNGAESSLDRTALASCGRLVIKVGSSSLTREDGHLDVMHIAILVDAIGAARARGQEVALVSSGAIAAGLLPLGLTHRPYDLPTQQAAAAVGQGQLLELYTALFRRFGLSAAQVLLTTADLEYQERYHNARATMDRLLELGVVPIVNENDTVATQELRFGDNDRLAALTSHLVHADALLLVSDVDALYTAHPETPGARRIGVVRSADDVAGIDISRRGSEVGTGGMVTKLEAARIATGAGIAVGLTDLEHLPRLLTGEDVGTFFVPTGKRRPARLLWLAHISDPDGALVLDAGAVRAVTERKASLLPAGITAVRGSFDTGDPVDLVDERGKVVARGLVTYASADLKSMIGHHTWDLAASYGERFQRAAVHRDSLVVLR
ncbi:glutamate 5-kinase [Raineyella fluvialis]|uniref:Glutamate 5-kinase n=1 Tax=Raineyella fluvialis TaxID=2662261 RepID=A0A5Q2FBV7_9ACTN|nr:glutamate 5-kinase [Raineyella fluvialis]QGF24269.1 glutamate 5-kinase [Raineyella fluvialis]